MTTSFSLSEEPVGVAAENGVSSYILWRRESASGSIYFEFDDPKNGGYDNVRECTVDQDGCHLVLDSGELVHFYWNPQRHPQLPEFISALRRIYFGHPDLLEILGG